MSTDPLPPGVVAIRRDFHRYPELGFTEFRTASRLAAALQTAGWELRTGADALAAGSRLGVPDRAEMAAAYRRAVGTGAVDRFARVMAGGLTGVAGDLSGRRPGPMIAIRFDIDALPITEAAGPTRAAVVGDYRSEFDGVMHACGHDGHAAIGVELARRLSDRNFAGRVRLVFQPAEEGARGGSAMVAAGLMTGVDLLICVHLGLGLATGSFAPSVGGLLANTKLRARFTGVSAHASAAPQDGRHALLAAATALINVHAMPRFAGADTRVNVGMLAGGTSSNIIPSEAVMLLETRADDERVNAEMERRVRTILAGIATAHEVQVEMERIGAASTGVCSPRAADAVRAGAPPNLTEAPPFYVGVSDDATALMRAVQNAGGEATYCLVGADLDAPHHTPQFDIDEAALPQAVELLENVVRRHRGFETSGSSHRLL